MGVPVGVGFGWCGWVVVGAWGLVGGVRGGCAVGGGVVAVPTCCERKETTMKTQHFPYSFLEEKSMMLL